MEYSILINAGAYVVVLYTVVFMLNPMLWNIFSLTKHDYRDAVFSMLILELVVVGSCANLALVLASFFYVFGG
tara:strand:- start:1906 stop:2124 length:219 start_codon:yes stop_codon:yes gene_type:complete